MTEREDNVYRAKLAEQAERYDGKRTICEIFAIKTASLPFPLSGRPPTPVAFVVTLYHFSIFLLPQGRLGWVVGMGG